MSESPFYFKKSNGQKVYRYTVSGPAAEVAEYQAENATVSDNGLPMFFSTPKVCFGMPSFPLRKSKDGSYWPDFSAIQTAQERAALVGGESAFAAKVATSLYDEISDMFGAPKASVTAETPAETPAAVAGTPKAGKL